MSNVKDLQEILDKFPKDAGHYRFRRYYLATEIEEWKKNFIKKFSVFRSEFEKLEKELNEAILLCELQASRISGLETFKKQCKGKVLIDHKQLSERITVRTADFKAYGKIANWKKDKGKIVTSEEQLGRVCYHRVREEINFLKGILETQTVKETKK